MRWGKVDCRDGEGGGKWHRVYMVIDHVTEPTEAVLVMMMER